MGCASSVHASSLVDMSLFDLWRCSDCDSVQYARAAANTLSVTPPSGSSSAAAAAGGAPPPTRLHYSKCRQCNGNCFKNRDPLLWQCHACHYRQNSVSRPPSCARCRAPDTCFPPFASGGRLFLPRGGRVQTAPTRGGSREEDRFVSQSVGGIVRPSSPGRDDGSGGDGVGGGDGDGGGDGGGGRRLWWCEHCGVAERGGGADRRPSCRRCNRRLRARGDEATWWRCPHCSQSVLALARPRSCPFPGCPSFVPQTTIAVDAVLAENDDENGGGDDDDDDSRHGSTVPPGDSAHLCELSSHGGQSKNVALEQSDEALRLLAANLGGCTLRNVFQPSSTPEAASVAEEGLPRANGIDPGEGRGEGSISVRRIVEEKDESAGGAASAPMEAKLSKALDSITCPVCLEAYEVPIELPCGHSVCANHIHKLKGRCPLCRCTFSKSLVHTAPINAALAENVRAVQVLAGLANT